MSENCLMCPKCGHLIYKDIELRAEEFATEAHSETMRKDKKTPYIEHPKTVAYILKSLGVENKDVIAAAWLHDVMEDEGVTYEELKDMFNENVANYVQAVTRGALEDKKDRIGYMRRIAKSKKEIRLIKIADVIHNSNTIQYLKPENQKRMRDEIRDYYMPMAEKISPYCYIALKNNIERNG